MNALALAPTARLAPPSQLLLDTGDDNLVYHDESSWWGDGHGKKSTALNLVGKELMLIRSQLRDPTNA